MKLISAEALEQIEGRELIHAGAMRFAFPDLEGEEPGSGIIRVWSGHGPLEIDGEVYTGIGSAALITPSASSIGGANDGLTIEVSALDPATAQLVEDYDYHQKPVTIYRLICGPGGDVLLGSTVFMRGRVDSITINEVAGEKSSLQIQIEGPRRDMGRRGSRMRSNADQRALGGDAGMKHVGTAARKTLSWGNKPATAGGALGGVLGGVGPRSRAVINAILGRF